MLTVCLFQIQEQQRNLSLKTLMCSMIMKSQRAKWTMFFLQSREKSLLEVLKNEHGIHTYKKKYKALFQR